MGYSLNPELDPVCDFIENLIAQSLKATVPNLKFDIRTGNYSRASKEDRARAESSACPFLNLKQIAEQAKSGNTVAQSQMNEWNLILADQISSQAIQTLGNQIHTLDFMNMTTPEWLKHFNTPDLKASLTQRIAHNIGYPNKQIDIKFPEDEKDDQFFNVLRPIMRTNIEQALHQKVS